MSGYRTTYCTYLSNILYMCLRNSKKSHWFDVSLLSCVPLFVCMLSVLKWTLYVILFIGNYTARTTYAYIGSISSLTSQSLVKIILSFAPSCDSSVTVVGHQYLSIVPMWTVHMEFVCLLEEILEWNVSTEIFIKYQIKWGIFKK